MSMNDLLIECQNKVAQLEAERDKLAAALYEANNKLDDVRDSFCGKNLMISGWHLNGDLEPVDNWFDSNDWEPVPESKHLVDNICAKAVMDFAEVPRGAYLSGFVTAELTVYDVYQSARNHVKDNYAYDTQPWDDSNATTARNALNEIRAKAIESIDPVNFVSIALRHTTVCGDFDYQDVTDAFNYLAAEHRQAANGGE